MLETIDEAVDPLVVPPPPNESRPFALTGSRTRQSLQLMWRGMASFPRTYLLAVGTSALFGVATVAVSRAVGWATENVVVPAIDGGGVTPGRIATGGLIIVAAALALAFGVWGRRVWAGWGVVDIMASHRRRLAQTYLRLPMSWHRSHSTGTLLAHAAADAEAAVRVFNPLPFALGVIVMFLTAAVSLILMDPWLALAAFTMLPLMIAANAIFQRHMSPAVTKAQQLRGDLSDVAHESFEAALLVKSLGTADKEESRFDEITSRVQTANTRVGRVKAVFDPVIDFLPSFATLLVLLVGAWRVNVGGLGTGDVVSAAYLMILLSVPVRSFGWVLGELPPGLVGHGRLAGVIDNPAEVVPGDLTVPPGVAGFALDIEDLSFAIDGVEILADIDATIPAGTITAIVGPTGCGKTTLASLLDRLFDPTRGRILINGIDISHLKALDGVAYVSQQTFIFEDTVRGNVVLTDGEVNDSDVWEALRAAHVADVVENLPGGLDAKLGERGANLSGGQRQRIAIARALYHNPRLLILDDATSAVDPKIEMEILAGFGHSGHSGGDGPTVVLVAYRMSSISLASNVLHLENGRLIDQGTPAELLARDSGFREIATAYEEDAKRRTEAAELVGGVTGPADQGARP
ncbi:MAG: ABC transporter ATP-binding protein/permease [Promicromonosporaceae bacterium]|nr:ABC transporter ATP-binding protein/permease [Promicromonosporaceae bacterium]